MTPENDISDTEIVQLDLELVKQNVPQYTSQKLCEMIVCDRYFGFDKKVSVICMEELSKRRETGDAFDFETQIELFEKEMPIMETGTFDIRKVLQQAIKMKGQ